MTGYFLSSEMLKGILIGGLLVLFLFGVVFLVDRLIWRQTQKEFQEEREMWEGVIRDLNRYAEEGEESERKEGKG